MKCLSIILFFLLLRLNVRGQANNQEVLWESKILSDPNLQRQEFKDSLKNFNLGHLWTQTDNGLVFGFIGNHYQRIRVKVFTATKDVKSPYTYSVTGKYMIKNLVSSFSGTIKIVIVRVYKNINLGVDSEYLDSGIKKEGLLLAKYHFSEASNQSHSGVFSGLLTTFWYMDKNGKIKYDDIESYSDGYCNNQFVGIWEEYYSSRKETCNWGDYRIPFSGDLDEGAGEFSPADQYLKYGWESYREAYFYNNKQAQEKEAQKWWK